jgi:ribonuclease E
MTFRMLIDAAHPEETRVVVEENQQITEFDFESETKLPLRGNIYLAKVTRVEPSLQAAFVDYGGNRHGFLAFSEIHPDYYQIPVSDREELLREHAAEQEEADKEIDTASENNDDEAGEEQADHIENLGGDAHEEVGARQPNLTRKYKIQEVIKRRQIILVQVVKEERGNKGAALTTYLSLAGRYCVLMPNTARGGGISRKINNAADRKKLKAAVAKLDVPDGMGLIIRTAGAQRTAVEIKRDYKYLSKTWEDVRNQTLKSSAPALVYEEGSLIRRCIRDLYNKDYDEVVVDGADAYSEARDYMKLLMPSHARKVKQHKGTQALFRESGIEDQLAAMFNPVVHLPSGGYLVINQTEALVAVDVNSGKSTSEYSIEKTAVNTNLEAAEEVARQMRLRDLAGLLVIDFIDMDENRNNRAVEKRLKEALKSDRARIQVGRISPFGLLEMSRQRIRSGVVDSSSNTCKHCQGTGMVRSVESRALHVLRQIGEVAQNAQGGALTLGLPTDVALYLLNQKRSALRDLEAAHNLDLVINVDDHLMAMEMTLQINEDGEVKTLRMDAANEAKPPHRGNRNRRDRDRDRKRDRDNHDRNNNDRDAQDGDTLSGDDNQTDSASGDRQQTGDAEADGEEPRGRRRRRGRRGGRNRRRSDAPEASQENGEEVSSEVAEMEMSDLPADTLANSSDLETDQTEADAPKIAEEAVAEPVAGDAATSDDKAKKPRRGRRKKAEAAPDEVVDAADAAEETGPIPDEVEDTPQSITEDAAGDNDAEKPRRGGWWRRK